MSSVDDSSKETNDNSKCVVMISQKTLLRRLGSLGKRNGDSLRRIINYREPVIDKDR